MRPRLALLLALALGASGAAETLRLKVLTYNVWGLWLISKAREARLSRIGPAVAELGPDLAAFQEAWVGADQERLIADLAAAGWPHARRFPGFGIGSGLLVVSRWPLSLPEAHYFSHRGRPWAVWRGDWYASKGVGVVRVQTPLGPVDLANTHLHARYGSDEYLGVQLTQAHELTDFLGARAARGPPVPLLLAGDLNSRRNALPFRWMTSRLGLQLSPGKRRIDWVLGRGTREIGLRMLSARRVLEETVDLGGGERRPLSDHEGVLVELELTRGGPAGTPVTPADLEPSRVARDVGAQVRREITLRERRGLLYGLLALAAALLARRLGTERRRCLVPVLLVLAFALFVALVHEPGLRSGLVHFQAEIEGSP